MNYELHEELFLLYQARLDNKEYRDEKERKFLEEHAAIHQRLAAEHMPDHVLMETGIRYRQNPLFPQFGDN